MISARGAQSVAGDGAENGGDCHLRIIHALGTQGMVKWGSGEDSVAMGDAQLREGLHHPVAHIS